MPDISLIPQRQKKRALPRFATFRGPRFELGTATKVGIILVVIAFLATVILFFWTRSLEDSKELLQEEFKVIVLERDVSLEKKLKNVNSLIQSFDGIFNNHRNWSELFKVLEERTVRGIVFTSFDGSYDSSNFSLDPFSQLEQTCTGEQYSRESSLGLLP